MDAPLPDEMASHYNNHRVFIKNLGRSIVTYDCKSLLYLVDKSKTLFVTFMLQADVAQASTEAQFAYNEVTSG